MARIVLLGPPGAGKGTQAVELARRLGIPHYSTGELLREEVRRGSEVGREADRYMRAGDLVPDELVLRVLRGRLGEPAALRGFILDGYPRTREQAAELARLSPLDQVLFFDLPESDLLGRLTERRNCPRCGRGYNLATLPPRTDERCDDDGTPLTCRADDAPEAVRTRLEVYAAQTSPLLDYYASRGLLRRVDARGAPAEVTERLLAGLRP